jgi:hypothetical protein
VATKKIELPSTGFYRRRIESVVVSGDLHGLSDLQSMLDKASSRDASLPSLNDLKQQAETFLRQYLIEEFGGINEIPESDHRAIQSAGIDFVVGRRIEATWEDLNTKFQKPLSQEENRKLIKDLRRVERASDACDMLHCLSVISSQIKCGSPEVAISHGVWLGIAYERFRVRASEHKAWTGGQNLQASSKGGRAAREGARQRHKKIAANFRASGLSQRAYARTAKIPVSTLKYALKKVGSNPAK